MNKKSFLMLGVALLFQSMLLFGGAQQEGQSGDSVETIRFAAFQGGYGVDFWNQSVERFEAGNPNIDVDAIYSPKIFEIIKPQILAGDPPDVCYWGDSPLFHQLIQEGAVHSLSDLFETEAPDGKGKFKDIFMEGMLDNCKVRGDDNIYWAPVSFGGLGLWCNMALLEENGWEVPNTWDEFFELGHKAKAKGIASFIYPGIYPNYISIAMWSSIAQIGGMEAVNALLTCQDGAYKQEALLKVYKYMERIHKEGLLYEPCIGMNHTQSQSEFLNGKALFLPGGTWLENEMKDVQPPQYEYKYVIPFAEKKNAKRYYGTIYEDVWINAGTNTESAEKFVKSLYSEENVLDFVKTCGGLMPIKGIQEIAGDYMSQSLKSWVNEITEKDAQAFTIKPIVLPNTVTLNPFVEMEKMYGAIITGEKTPEEACEELEAMNQDVRAALGN